MHVFKVKNIRLNLGITKLFSTLTKVQSSDYVGMGNRQVMECRTCRASFSAALRASFSVLCSPAFFFLLAVGPGAAAQPLGLLAGPAPVPVPALRRQHQDRRRLQAHQDHLQTG